METKDRNNQRSETEMLARVAAHALSDKKGEDVRILDLRELQTAPARFFVIATGNVPSHVSAMSDAVHEAVKKMFGQNPSKVEGYSNAEWILMDYFDVVVHIFQKEKRDYYHLEQLWADGKEIKIENKE